MAEAGSAEITVAKIATDQNGLQEISIGKIAVAGDGSDPIAGGICGGEIAGGKVAVIG